MSDSAVTSNRADEPLPVWHLAVAYNGTNFLGWQVQPDAVTVQGELQSRLRLIFRDPDLKIIGTSRTDAGVHALDQHVTFSAAVSRPLTCEALKYKLNHWLPLDIRVVSVSREPAGFSARRSALAKAYTYVIDHSHVASPFNQAVTWHYPATVNMEHMKAAARILEGQHDFRAFAANPRRVVESTIRTIHQLEVVAKPPYLCLNVIGDSFLYKMVRTLAGYIVLQAGRDHDWTPEKLHAMLAAQERSPQTRTAPPGGLFLANVFFEHGGWKEYAPILPPFAWHPAHGAHSGASPGRYP